MANYNIMLLIFFCVSFTVIVPAVLAGEANEHLGFAEVDDFVQQRARNASRIAMESYVQNPEKMTQVFNKEVMEHLVGTNGTRRRLKDSGNCHATNPIDRCWRCDANWYNNRKKLADCARGFGHKATGGKDGRYYVVNDSSDDDVVNPKPGTLRHAVIQEEPLWIIFSKSMVITLKQELLMAGDKTIDGRGVNVHIAYGAGITIQFVNNVIIHGIRIHDIIVTSGGIIRDSILHLGLRTISDGDGISLFGATNVWIDHVSLAKCSDGLVDAIMASTAITISNCKLNHHNDVILLGANDGYQGDQIMQVTVAFNRFGKGCIQRMPRCRWGFFHVVNNDYNKWEMYAIGGSQHPTIISQGNRFRADDNPNTKEITHRDYFPEFIWRNWQWRSEGDLYLNGAFFRESGPQLVEDLDLHENMVNAKPGTFAGRLTRYAGALKCKPGKPC